MGRKKKYQKWASTPQAAKHRTERQAPRPPDVTRPEMALEAAGDEADARYSVHQPEVKLEKIMMADLTGKDSTGEICAFHEKKARDHGGCNLGSGSFGEVYKAVHAVHGQVAVKLANPGKRDHVVMYQKEAQKHESSLRCDHIVSIKGFVQCEYDACSCGLIGIVMEYMKHGSLWNFRTSSKWQAGPDLWPLTNRMVYQISSGMLFLHSKNIIHRDLKLENVLVDGNLHAKVADIGLATNLQTSSGDKHWGTDSHKPPEAFRKDLPISTKVVTRKYDVYCFAMTLYELLTGEHPYPDRGFNMLRLLKVVAKQSPSLQPVPVSTPEDLIRVMEQSWSYEPNDRPNFREITDWVANLDTNPTHDSLGHYLGEQRSSKKEGNTDNESIGRGLEDLTENDHTPVEQSNESPVVAPSQPRSTESPVVAPSQPRSTESPGVAPSQPSSTESPVAAPSQPRSTESPVAAPSQPRSTERDPTIIFDSSQPSDDEFANESRKSFTPTQLDTGKATINMKSAENVVFGSQQIINNYYHGSKWEETGEGAGGHSSGRQPQKTSHQEMEFEADDARLSSHQPEVKLDKIMMKMADLTVKDSSGQERAFHETKAREHEGCHLGGGSFGEVYKAVHIVHDDVAVKLAKPGKRDQLVMYKKEAGKHVIALTSNCIVSIKGFVQCEDDACNCGLIGIVMEYMQHGSLWDFRISKWQDRPDPWPLTNMMVYQISSGMHFLHSNNIIHRDLKLENVLVDGNLHVKVADLGLATNLQTSSGDKCWGTDSHKPPEAFRTDLPNSTKVVTREYDVYCFAMTLYELLTGIHPYSDRGFYMLRLLKVEAKQPPSLQPVPVSTPKDLKRVMEQSWSYEPNDRPNFREIKDWVKQLKNQLVSIQDS